MNLNLLVMKLFLWKKYTEESLKNIMDTSIISSPKELSTMHKTPTTVLAPGKKNQLTYLSSLDGSGGMNDFNFLLLLN